MPEQGPFTEPVQRFGGRFDWATMFAQGGTAIYRYAMKNTRKARQQPPVAEPPANLLRFLTRKEAARELRMSVTKLDRVIASGELKAKRHGHAVIVMRSEIERYIEAWPDVPTTKQKK